ncbi:hypothetical protein M5K25_006237 [Dendrobium thyrsiflorum]|uniref:Uncharacterized protein n=1 Tax=Dendrobium thyrsiflorum TaxID=117978 RepID=A0ABD0VAP2_DENTH
MASMEAEAEVDAGEMIRENWRGGIRVCEGNLRRQGGASSYRDGAFSLIGNKPAARKKTGEGRTGDVRNWPELVVGCPAAGKIGGGQLGCESDSRKYWKQSLWRSKCPASRVTSSCIMTSAWSVKYIQFGLITGVIVSCNEKV